MGWFDKNVNEEKKEDVYSKEYRQRIEEENLIFFGNKKEFTISSGKTKIIIDDKFITLIAMGWLEKQASNGGKGIFTIKISSITSIKLRNVKTFAGGYLQLNFTGSEKVDEEKDKYNCSNVIRFYDGDYENILKIRKMIMERM